MRRKWLTSTTALALALNAAGPIPVVAEGVTQGADGTAPRALRLAQSDEAQTLGDAATDLVEDATGVEIDSGESDDTAAQQAGEAEQAAGEQAEGAQETAEQQGTEASEAEEKTTEAAKEQAEKVEQVAEDQADAADKAADEVKDADAAQAAADTADQQAQKAQEAADEQAKAAEQQPEKQAAEAEKTQEAADAQAEDVEQQAQEQATEAEQAADKQAEKVDAAKQKAGDAQQKADEAEQATEDQTEAAEQKADETEDAASEKADAAAQKTDDAEPAAEEKADAPQQAADKADDTASEQADAAEKQAEGGDQTADEAAKDTKKDTAEAPEVSAEAQAEAVAEESDSAPAAAAASGEGEVVETDEGTVTEEQARQSDEEFATTASGQQTAPAAKKDDDDDKLLKAVGAAAALGLGAYAVGKLLDNGSKVVSNTGDRAVVQDPNGQYRVIKDDDTLLRRPGSNVSTQTYSDGSTRTEVVASDNSSTVTIRAADGRVLRRTRILPSGEEVVLFDDTQQVERVDVSDLQPAREQDYDYSESDVDSLRAALGGNNEALPDRTFSLNQIRRIDAVRHLVPVIALDAINFRTGSAVIEPREAESLSALGNAMRDTIEKDPREVFLIEGHTDTVGDASYNLALSDRRAESVALALTEYFDVPPSNMIVQGYGESDLRVARRGDIRANRRGAVRNITPLLHARK